MLEHRLRHPLASCVKLSTGHYLDLEPFCDFYLGPSTTPQKQRSCLGSRYTLNTSHGSGWHASRKEDCLSLTKRNPGQFHPLRETVCVPSVPSWRRLARPGGVFSRCVSLERKRSGVGRHWCFFEDSGTAVRRAEDSPLAQSPWCDQRGLLLGSGTVKWMGWGKGDEFSVGGLGVGFLERKHQSKEVETCVVPFLLLWEAQRTIWFLLGCKCSGGQLTAGDFFQENEGGWAKIYSHVIARGFIPCPVRLARIWGCLAVWRVKQSETCESNSDEPLVGIRSSSNLCNTNCFLLLLFLLERVFWCFKTDMQCNAAVLVQADKLTDRFCSLTIILSSYYSLSSYSVDPFVKCNAISSLSHPW